MPRLMIFLKAPRAGVVKTRLARTLGHTGAVRIYRLLADRQLRNLPREWEVEIRFTPDEAAAEMRAWLGPRWIFVPQGEGDLGARLARGFDDAFSRGGGPVLAIGGDCPDLDAATLRDAAQRLLAADVVLGPAVDGGYYLIGLRRSAPTLFTTIAWSSPAVLAETRARAADAGLSCALLTPKEDIDDAAAWARHCARVGAAGAEDVTPAAPELAVIIPALNEAAGIRASIERVSSCFPTAAVLVADGGSTDGTPAVARAAGAMVLTAPRGRGSQCRAGASSSHSRWMLFLHADTLLPPNAADVVARFTAGERAKVATFRLRFDSAGWFLRLCGWCTRLDSVFTRFGDQGILIRRQFYEAIGGFPDWPLFEDVALLQHARRRGRIASLPAYVTTSARRFRARGAWRQQVLNARLLLRYLAGASPHALARLYGRTGAAPAGGPNVTTAAVSLALEPPARGPDA